MIQYLYALYHNVQHLLAQYRSINDPEAAKVQGGWKVIRFMSDMVYYSILVMDGTIQHSLEDEAFIRYTHWNIDMLDMDKA